MRPAVQVKTSFNKCLQLTQRNDRRRSTITYRRSENYCYTCEEMRKDRRRPAKPKNVKLRLAELLGRLKNIFGLFSLSGATTASSENYIIYDNAWLRMTKPKCARCIYWMRRTLRVCVHCCNMYYRITVRNYLHVQCSRCENQSPETDE